jgi:glycosyltransferase involved in cell wall biosynthesis
MRMPPDANGHGGSQRAWHLVQALRQHGEVHFVLLYRNNDHDCVNTSLAPLQKLVKSVTSIEIPGWRGLHGRQLGVFHPGIGELFKMRSHEAPRLREPDLRAIAARLPERQPDLIFAGRLCTAVIAQALIDHELLAPAERVVDFDDLMSKFRDLQVRKSGGTLGRQGRLLARLDVRIIARAERRIARDWRGISLCTDEDVAALRAASPEAHVVKLPNIVNRDFLPARAPDGRFRLLFIGNLGFSANTAGLAVFLQELWPWLQQNIPQIALDVVGINPPAALAAQLEGLGIALHANVPSVRPYYENCDVVIAPILFGSGTRIKILEAMAYGRPVVSTAMGADGLGLRDGEEILLAPDMQGFGEALLRLARNPELCDAIAGRARAFQQRHYGPEVICEGMRDLLGAAAAPRQSLAYGG